MDFVAHHRYTVGVALGLCFGILTRINLLRTDYRQYPTYPHGQIIHISLGVIAAGLGAVSVPALLDKNYTAITFLALAAQQFRAVRNMERQTLSQLDEWELVPRGATYIEGIAMVFEGRNYLVIFVAFIATLFATLTPWYWGIVAGFLALIVSNRYKSGRNLSHVADMQEAIVHVDGCDIYVDNIYMMNIGLKEDQKIYEEQSLGFILKPKNLNDRVTLSNLGQRQAMLHDLSTILGVYRDSGQPAIIPITKLDLKDGRLGVLILPLDRNKQKALKALQRVPLLENAVRLPEET